MRINSSPLTIASWSGFTDANFIFTPLFWIYRLAKLPYFATRSARAASPEGESAPTRSLEDYSAAWPVDGRFPDVCEALTPAGPLKADTHRSRPKASTRGRARHALSP